MTKKTCGHCEYWKVQKDLSIGECHYEPAKLMGLIPAPGGKINFLCGWPRISREAEGCRVFLERKGEDDNGVAKPLLTLA